MKRKKAKQIKKVRRVEVMTLLFVAAALHEGDTFGLVLGWPTPEDCLAPLSPWDQISYSTAGFALPLTWPRGSWC